MVGHNKVLTVAVQCENFYPSTTNVWTLTQLTQCSAHRTPNTFVHSYFLKDQKPEIQHLPQTMAAYCLIFPL